MRTGRPDYDKSIVDLRGLSLRQVEARWRAGNEAPPRSLGAPIPEDEPVFILRATDVVANQAIHCYADLAAEHGASDFHVEHARAWAAEVHRWQEENQGRAKVPDLPPQRCRKCGCTDDAPCPDGPGGVCYWIEADLCSRCVEPEAKGQPDRRRIEERALHDAHLNKALSLYREGSLTWTEAMEAAVLALSEEAGRLRGDLVDLPRGAPARTAKRPWLAMTLTDRIDAFRVNVGPLEPTPYGPQPGDGLANGAVALDAARVPRSVDYPGPPVKPGWIVLAIDRGEPKRFLTCKMLEAGCAIVSVERCETLDGAMMRFGLRRKEGR